MGKIFQSIVYTILITNCYGQNSSAPYSVYGIGDISIREYNRLSGMGNTGVAIQSKAFIINKNPAALAGLEKGVLTVELSGNAKSLKFEGSAINLDNNKQSDFTIEKINLAVKVNRYWGSNIGLKKFSAVNYRYNSTKSIDGSAKVYNTLYDGDGGLNDVYWINSFALTKHLSFGIKTSFLFGSINKTETLSDQQNNYAIVTTLQDYFSKLQTEYGLIYSLPLGKNEFSAGIKFSPKGKLNADRTLTVVENNDTIISDKFIKTDRFTFPQIYAIGVSLKSATGILYALDFQAENWSNTNMRGNGWSLRNSNRTSIGVEFPKTVKVFNTSYERRFWQLGAYMDNSYLSVSGKQIKSYGITAGTGGILTQNLLYAVAVEVGSKGTTTNGLIKENYLGVVLTFSYREFMSSRGRKYR